MTVVIRDLDTIFWAGPQRNTEVSMVRVPDDETIHLTSTLLIFATKIQQNVDFLKKVK